MNGAKAKTEPGLSLKDTSPVEQIQVICGYVESCTGSSPVFDLVLEAIN